MDAQELSDEEFARRGNEIFEERVRPNVDVDAEAHKFVAIDIETGAYAVHGDERMATKQLLERPRPRGESGSAVWVQKVPTTSARVFGLMKSVHRDIDWSRNRGQRGRRTTSRSCPE
jgi:hypothetical protein